MWKLMGQVKSQHCSPRHFKTKNDVMWLNSEIISECFTSNEAQRNAVLSSCCTQQNSVIAQFGNVGMLPAVQPALAPPQLPSPPVPHSMPTPHPPPPGWSHKGRPCDARGKSRTSLAQPLPSLTPLCAQAFSQDTQHHGKEGDPVAHPTLPSEGSH